MIRELNGTKKLYGEDMMRGLYGKIRELLG